MSRKNTVHEYTTTKKEFHAVIFRVSNYFVLISMRIFDANFPGAFPDLTYFVVASAVVGYDIYQIRNAFIKKRSNYEKN